MTRAVSASIAVRQYQAQVPIDAQNKNGHRVKPKSVPWEHAEEIELQSCGEILRKSTWVRCTSKVIDAPWRGLAGESA